MIWKEPIRLNKIVQQQLLTKHCTNSWLFSLSRRGGGAINSAHWTTKHGFQDYSQFLDQTFASTIRNKVFSRQRHLTTFVMSRNISTSFWEVNKGSFALVDIVLGCHKSFGDLLYRFGNYNLGTMFVVYSLCHPNYFMGMSWNTILAHNILIFHATFSSKLYTI